MSDFPQVFTFYSFKGGVGRSMAVLNVAYALAGRGRNVLVLDMDLEAPGLSGFLRRHQEVGEFARYDVIDLVQWAAQISAARNSGEKLDRSAPPPLSDYVVGVLSEKLAPLRPSRGELGRVDIIPVDDRDERDYYGRLTALGIGSFDHEALRQIGSVLNVWLKSREFAVEVPGYYGSAGERTGKYDYVLVDSRTGVTEIGGLCIGPLSDHLVVFTGLNDQNIAGTSHFLREVGVRADGDPEPAAPDEGESRSQGLDPKPTMIVATPVPSGELDSKKERLDHLERMVGAVVCQLSYHPQLALMETIFVRDYAREYLALEYNELVDRLMRQAKDGTDFDPMQLMMKSGASLDEKQRDLINKAIRNSSITGSHVALGFVLSRIRFDSLLDDMDFVLLDRIHRILAGHKDNRDYDKINNWANLISAWALNSKEPEHRSLRIAAAMEFYVQVIAASDAPPEQKAKALYNRGVTKGQLEDHQGAIADYTAVLEMPDAPPEPKAKALNNRGVSKGQLEDHQGEIADYTAVLGMPDAPPEPKAKALFNRGVTKGQLKDHQGAIADYTAVLEMPDAPPEQKADALSNRGWCQYEQSRFEEAIADYLEAIKLDTKDCNSRGNLAVALLVINRTEEALSAYEQALLLAKLENVSDMENDLNDALEKHGSIPGAEQVRERIARRRAELQK